MAECGDAEEAIELAKHNANLNQARIRFVQADLFAWLREVLATGRDASSDIARQDRLAALTARLVAAGVAEESDGALVMRVANDHSDFDVTVVDQSDDDRTGAVVRSLAAGDPRLRYAHTLPPGLFI